MRKNIGRLFTMSVVGAVALAPAAGAYRVPGKPPGSPGGPPGKSKGGNRTTQNPTTHLGNKLAGQTDSELAHAGSFNIKVHFPKAGVMACTVSSNGKKLGAGSATAQHGGNKTLKVTLTSAGKSFLNSHNGHATPVTVKCVFTPKHGNPSTSITHLKTLA